MLTIRCTHPDHPKDVHTLIAGQTYTVGRKGCDLSFPSDQSISRNHAEIVVEHPIANMTDHLLTPTVVVTDLGSKFGTFANDGIERKSKMAMREALNLSPGDRFKFGLQWNEFKIEYTPLVATPSAVKEPQLKKLKIAIASLGGHLVQEWLPNCDYVVMESVSLTVKAVCALLAAKYIVTPEFFDDMLECTKTGKTMPDPNKYLPPLVERSLPDGVTIEPISARAELFKDKVFVFCSSKHMKKLSIAVEAGGGICKLLSNVGTRDLLKENYILMRPTDRDLIIADHDTRSSIDEYKKTKRQIQDSELGLAAVHMSIEAHCNPYHTFENTPTGKLASQTQHPNRNETIVPATQEMETQRSFVEDSCSKVGESFSKDKSKEKKDVKIKPEVLSEKRDLEEDDDVCEILSEGVPPSKKRPARDALPRSEARGKRYRPETRSGTQKSGLSAIFGMSDDEDDDEVIVPESQNLNIENVGESLTMNPEVEAENADIVPESPNISGIENEISNIARTSVTPENSPTKRSTRSQARGTPEKEVVFKEPEPVVQNKTRNKRKHGITPDTSPVKVEIEITKKQKTQQKESESSENLVQKAEKLTIKPESKDLLNGEPQPPTIEVIMAPLCKGPKVQPRMEVVGGKTVKNFKSFRKVLPLSLQIQGNVTVGSTVACGSSGTSVATISSYRSVQKLTFEVFNYTQQDDEDNNKQKNHNNKGVQSEEILPSLIKRSTTLDEDDNDMDIDDIMPEMNISVLAPAPVPETSTKASRRNTRANKKEAPDPPKAKVQEESPTRQTRSKRNVVPAPKLIASEEEEEDDMFQF